MVELLLNMAFCDLINTYRQEKGLDFIMHLPTAHASSTMMMNVNQWPKHSYLFMTIITPIYLNDTHIETIY